MKNRILFGLTIILSALLLVSILSAAIPAKQELEKINLVNYKDGTLKASIDGKGKGSDVCYKLLGVKWNQQVNYVINPTNSQGLSESFISNSIYLGAEQWDANTAYDLFGTYQIDSSAYYGNQNYRNEISFGNIQDTGVIAITTLWVDPSSKSIIESDIEFDTDWQWGDATKNASLMDVQNIATHELGHAIGLGDIYSSTCVAETMYGYSKAVETIKRTLNKADITGLRKIYGR